MIRMHWLGFLAVLLYPFNGNAGKVEIDVQHVGQGNCVLVKFSPDDKPSKYMLVDVGSSSYKTEMSLANKKMKAKSKEEKKNLPANKSKDALQGSLKCDFGLKADYSHR